MWKEHQRARGAGRRIIRWLVCAERLASAAAGNGEPALLLALAVYRRGHPSVAEHPRRLDGMDAADPDAVRPRGRKTNGQTHGGRTIGAMMGLSWQQGPLGRDPNGTPSRQSRKRHVARLRAARGRP